MVIRPKQFNNGPVMALLSFRLEQLVEVYGIETLSSWLTAYYGEFLLDGDFDLTIDRHMYNLVSNFKSKLILEWFVLVHKRKVG